MPADVGLLRAPENRVIVVTPSPDAELPPCRGERRATCASPTSPPRCARLRAEHGVRSVLCEGGPRLLGNLLPAGLVDELHLVIARQARRRPGPADVLTGAALDRRPTSSLLSLHESGGYLFLRYGL